MRRAYVTSSTGVPNPPPALVRELRWSRAELFAARPAAFEALCAPAVRHVCLFVVLYERVLVSSHALPPGTLPLHRDRLKSRWTKPEPAGLMRVRVYVNAS